MNIETKQIQLNGGQSNTLYNQIFFKKTYIFPDGFIQQCNDNENESQFVTIEVENNIRQMKME